MYQTVIQAVSSTRYHGAMLDFCNTLELICVSKRGVGGADKP